ncbi:tRNA splicing endonuclease 54 homolog (S. cerevisiae) [Nesidiocoris tenuis]|uniref:tRNA splicing endonuclease 54 homolog (S. cerevisiae) n=1 Tax=Nesidiocoris tenuis TaxID=355587 RepID=A0ABN7B5D1_9HEMI|nr:tRNA splicing endonuclease 54 homolog (S. cerevisiae) [Nesidiocoris tenuis]
MLPNIEAKRLGKLLSGDEIINSKNNSLKDLPSGCKDYSPDNSWLEQKQIQATLETYHNLIGAERIEKKQNLSSAIWVSDLGKAKVTKKSGKHWEVFGHTVDSVDWLYPEEALFLLEVNALELYVDEVPLSLEQTYSLVIGGHCPLGEYRVYAHLSRKGYRVLRHDKRITVTRYERDVRLDQIGLAERRDKRKTDTDKSDAKDVAAKGQTQDGANLESNPEESAKESSASQKLPDGKKKRDSSPEVMIIDDPDVEVITIDQDDDDVEITCVKTPSHVETVDLLESEDDDDDVVFVPQRPKNDDPSKWRKWYLSIRDFITKESSQDRSVTPKMTNLRAIDYFDLANKSVDSIMRAIPPHNGSVDFINAPDQRFIPVEILPKFAHYKISLNTEENESVHNDSSRVDTTQNLEDILRSDQPCNRYGYSYHRTRTFSYTRPNNPRPFGSFGNWTNRMHVSEQSQFFSNDSSNKFFQRSQRFAPRASQPFQNHSARFGQNNFQKFFGNAQQNWPPNQMAAAMNSVGQMLQQGQMQQQGQMGNPMGLQLKIAMQQACQMLAMSLMQSSQSLMQLNNPQRNQLSGPPIYKHRPHYHRGRWRGRGNWQKGARNSPKRPAETGVVYLVDGDDEDTKEKPKLKRVMALNAIANLNSPKKAKTEKNLKIEQDDKPSSTIELKNVEAKQENVVSDDDEKFSPDVISLSGSDECEVVSTATPTIELPPLPSIDRPSAIESESTLRKSPEPRADQQIVEIDSSTPEIVEVTPEENIDSEPAERKAEETSEAIEPPDLSAEAPMPVKPQDDAISQDSLSRDANVRPDNSDSSSAQDEPAVDSWEDLKKIEPALPSKSFRSILNYDEQRIGVADVLKSLQVVGPIDETDDTDDVLKVAYDVYLPNQPFRKSLQLVPNYRIIVTNSNGFPSVVDLIKLRATYKDDVPFVFAVVGDDSVGFYNVQTVELPTLIDDL